MLNLNRRINKLKSIWKLIRPDIIVSFIRKNNIMAIESAKGLKIPVVVSIRSNPSRELEGLEDVSFMKSILKLSMLLKKMMISIYFANKCKVCKKWRMAILRN